MKNDSDLLHVRRSTSGGWALCGDGDKRILISEN